MDRIDRKLLNLIQRDASRTNVDLADEVGLSPSSCLRRTQRLQKSGVIDRIVAILNPAKAGRVIKALVAVELKLHGEQHMRRFLDIAIPNETGPYAEETAQLIDREVKRIVTDSHGLARRILAERRDTLEAVTRRLLEKEVMEGAELRAIMTERAPAAADA